MKKLFTFFTFFVILSAKGQTLYFPPAVGNTWDTLSPSTFGWCQPRIDSLYNFLETRNTNGFIILIDGKIVLEKYFGTFTESSTNTWASAGKSLTAMLTGIAQKQGFLNINDTVSNHLGQGWTSCSLDEENQITIRNLITMTSGLDENPPGLCTNNSTNTNCLQYLAPSGTRWSYHTGAYRKMQDVIDSASGLDINAFTDTYLGAHIGMGGSWDNYIHSSNVRDAARFGLLALGKGIWANDTLISDTAYVNAMTNTSQNFNLSYGYLWWLNGKASHMTPGSQTVFNEDFIVNAPSDMFAALGAGDQKIYVAPGLNMVVVRLGNSAYGSAAAISPFDNELWGYIDSLNCLTTAVNEIREDPAISIFPNPAQNTFTIKLTNEKFDFIICDVAGRKVYEQKSNFNQAVVDCEEFPTGIYFAQITSGQKALSKKIIIE